MEPWMAANGDRECVNGWLYAMRSLIAWYP